MRIQALALATALLVACSEDGAGSGLGRLGGTKDSGLDGAEGTVPEASPGSSDAAHDASLVDAARDAYPIDPNGPPPDCILPCVWEVMKRCPGPEPGQACVHDGLSFPGSAGVNCCPMDPPAPEEPVLCADENWVDFGSSVYKDGVRCWWREGTASTLASTAPPTPADWTTTWYVPDAFTTPRAATELPA